MQNLSDNELDDLFRKAVFQSELNAEAGNSLADWEGMAGRLDETGTSGIWGRLAGWMILVIGLAGLLNLLVDKTETLMLTNLTGSTIENTRAVPNAHAVDSRVEETEATKTLHDGGATKVETKSMYTASGAPTNVPLYSNSKVVGQLPGQPVHENNPGHLPGQPVPTSSAPSTHQKIGEIADGDGLVIENQNTVTAEEDAEVIVAKSFVPRFDAKLVVSPDYSSVDATSPNGLGFNFGLLFEYRFAPRFSVAAGVLRARKIYSATNLEYNGVPAETVDGDCRMWDIPLNLYYHTQTVAKGWSLYVGAGLSSYLMSEENYMYHVYGGYGYYYTYDQQVRNKNNEWFSILNASIGIQKQLGGRFSLQAEPYLKAPLAGVGEGDVSLASYGAFINLVYRLH